MREGTQIRTRARSQRPKIRVEKGQREGERERERARDRTREFEKTARPSAPKIPLWYLLFLDVFWMISNCLTTPRDKA